MLLLNLWLNFSKITWLELSGYCELIVNDTLHHHAECEFLWSSQIDDWIVKLVKLFGFVGLHG